MAQQKAKSKSEVTHCTTSMVVTSFIRVLKLTEYFFVYNLQLQLQ